MGSVQLIRVDRAAEEPLENDPAFVEAMMKEDWSGASEVILRHLGSHPLGRSVDADSFDWGSAYAIDSETRELVGSCAFKGPPADDGSIEIAYFTYHGFEGRGYATAMAKLLIAVASRSPAVSHVVAHTLPHGNASTRVLAKSGMTFVGEITDPDDGQVWRWELALRV